MCPPCCGGKDCACLRAAQELLELLKGKGLPQVRSINEHLPSVLVLPCVSAARLLELEAILREEIAKRIAAVDLEEKKP